MTISTVKMEVPNAIRPNITDNFIVLDLSDKRTISPPLVWYPRFLAGTPRERSH